jgi:NADPH-dependent 2,4-dienoyl-CoA reductase/sulfur reductase-like enzyme
MPLLGLENMQVCQKMLPYQFKTAKINYSRFPLIDQDSIISYGGCGIPYFVCGDVAEPEGLRSTSFHSLRDADYFTREKGFAVRSSTRALKINRQKKELLGKDLNSGKDEVLPYDKLVLATGSTPFIPPPL